MQLRVIEEPDVSDIPDWALIVCEKCGHRWEDWDEYGGPYKCSECGHVKDIEIEELGIDGELGRETGQCFYCWYCGYPTKNISFPDNPNQIYCKYCEYRKQPSEYECPKCGSERAALIECTNYRETGIPWDAHGHSWTEHRRCLFCGTDFSFDNADY